VPQTLSVIKADTGGHVGHTAVHPEMLDLGREELAKAVQRRLLIDGQAHVCGDDMFLVMSHDHGQDDTEIHKFAWDTFVLTTEVAKRLKLYGAGQDLLVDAFSGNIRGMGPGSAELELEERQSEPVIVFMGDKTSSGAFNLPFYKMFADPFNTAGLIIAEPLHAGFAFEVHDLKEHKKIVFNCPEDLYDLLVFIGSPSRFAVKRVMNRSTGEICGVSSTDKLSLIAGRYVGKDDPAAIVRCQGAFPAIGEALEPFTTPYIVEGFMRGSHNGPWMPVSVADAHPARFDGPPRVVALGFQLANGMLGLHRDMFDDPSFNNARQKANDISDFLRLHGVFEPHRLPLDEMEYTTMTAVAEKTAPRWSAM